MGEHHPKVDAYIARARPFAQPILVRLRELVHRACPGVTETIKWGRPFFEYKGVILGNMAAFTAHCSFGFWGREIGDVLRQAGVVRGDAMGSLGRMTSVASLPPEKRMLGWIRQAAAFIDSGQYTSPMARRVVKPAALEIPGDFAAALGKNKRASTVFAGFSPGCRREYIEWITGAKRSETRARRIATAVDWIGEGKQRNWKYQ